MTIGTLFLNEKFCNFVTLVILSLYTNCSGVTKKLQKLHFETKVFKNNDLKRRTFFAILFI